MLNTYAKLPSQSESHSFPTGEQFQAEELKKKTKNQSHETLERTEGSTEHGRAAFFLEILNIRS